MTSEISAPPTATHTPTIRSAIGVIAALVLIGALIQLSLRQLNQRGKSAHVEKRFVREGLRLLPISSDVPEGRAGQTVSVGLRELQNQQLYLRKPTDERCWLHIDTEGQVLTAEGRVGTVRRSAELLLVPSELTLFVDDVPVELDHGPWEALWVLPYGSAVPPKANAIPRLDIRDDFMRDELEVHPYAKVTAGTVKLAQHGGGMPTSPDQEADPNFQRAVNPFSIHASEGGRLSYHVHAPARWGDAHAEASFYFGIPKTGHVVDRDTAPTGTDMLLVMGPEEGSQIAFGWSGTEACFLLQSRNGQGPWTVLSRWREKRPPLTDWVKIALECRQGYRVQGLLDGVPVLSADLPRRLQGPFHIQCGHDLTEFDDVRAWSLPTPPPQPTPLLIRSRQFAGKQHKDKADPDQFGEWAESSHAFRKVRWRDDTSGTTCAGIVTGEGIIGDVVCESPGRPQSGNPADVGYRIALYPAKPDGSADIRADAPLCILQASRTDGGWMVRGQTPDRAGPDADLAVNDLVVARRADQNQRFCLRSEGQWLPISDPVQGAVHVAIIREAEDPTRERFLLSPDPAHHTVRCTNLIHELFEDAPTAWNWVDGAFRMDCRWACQDQWNFMACGSTGLPNMTSKRVFNGDQIHEAFMSLRATFPWDAGDATFQYDSAGDRANKFPILIAANAWYNRHDLNISFCSDGKNPLSGYCVLFGGEDNTVTRLLRRGVSVAESRLPEHVFANDASFMVVHWPWWRFTVRKSGTRVRVHLNNEPLFDYTDPEPIDGGHIGFWSVRSGFAISRISSMAEAISMDAHAAYVSANAMHNAWTPLVRNAVRLTADSSTGMAQVTNTFGGGFFAVRYTPEQPIDLRETPRLTLPLQLGQGARINLHLEVGGKAFVVRVGDAPLSGIKAFLVPGSEKGECFQLKPIPEGTVRSTHLLAELPGDEAVLEIDLLGALRKLTGTRVEPILTCLTIGNSSNTGYLMAGNGGNAAGSSYSVGTPRWQKTAAPVGDTR